MDDKFLTGVVYWLVGCLVGLLLGRLLVWVFTSPRRRATSRGASSLVRDRVGVEIEDLSVPGPGRDKQGRKTQWDD